MSDKGERVVDYVTDTPYPNYTHYRANIYTVNRNVAGLNALIGSDAEEAIKLPGKHAFYHRPPLIPTHIKDFQRKNTQEMQD